MNIKKKIQEITTKAVEKYALIQLEAKEKRDKKRADERKRQKLRESITCPYCFVRYSSSQYYSDKTKKEDIKIKQKYSNVYLNFFECANCNKLFGVKTSHHYEPGLDIVRSSFSLTDKELT